MQVSDFKQLVMSAEQRFQDYFANISQQQGSAPVFVGPTAQVRAQIELLRTDRAGTADAVRLNAA